MKVLISVLNIVTVLLFYPAAAGAQNTGHHMGQSMMRADSATGIMSESMMHHRQQMMSEEGMQQPGMRHGMMDGQMMPCPMAGQGMMGNMMPGSMGQGMHGGMAMMDSRFLMKKQHMLINRLPEMKIQLSLTDNQVEQLQQMRDEFQKKQIDLGAVLAKNGIDLRTAVATNVPVSDIRTRLEEMAGIRIDMLVEAYETAGKMKNILNDEQKIKLENQVGSGMMRNMMQ